MVFVKTTFKNKTETNDIFIIRFESTFEARPHAHRGYLLHIY